MIFRIEMAILLWYTVYSILQNQISELLIESYRLKKAPQKNIQQ